MLSDTLGLDNGGDSGSAYLGAAPFSLRLPGPFSLRAGIGLPPYPDSLSPALRPTSPVLSLSRFLNLIINIAHSVGNVKFDVRRLT